MLSPCKNHVKLHGVSKYSGLHIIACNFPFRFFHHQNCENITFRTEVQPPASSFRQHLKWPYHTLTVIGYGRRFRHRHVILRLRRAHHIWD